MAKVMSNGMIDGGLTKFGACTNIAVLSAEPLIFADIATYTLAATTLVGGDFTLAAGDTSGRKSTVAQKANVSITATGSATHVAVHDGVSEYSVTTCTTQALTINGTVTIGTHSREISAPV